MTDLKIIMRIARTQKGELIIFTSLMRMRSEPFYSIRRLHGSY